MKKIRFTYIALIFGFLLQFGLGSNTLYAQNALQRRLGVSRDSLQLAAAKKDSLLTDSLNRRNQLELKLLEAPVDTAILAIKTDSIQKEIPQPKKRFIPDSNRSVWLALVFPGGGQIYNRKYWKLPIVYGGVVACIYAVNWNAQMLRDYSQAYQDITDNDPTTSSYLEMLPLGYDISGREEHFKTVFKRKKDFYRRYRDLSIFFIAGVYVLSIVDAYVDAELSTFDISPNLSLSVEPQMISGSSTGTVSPFLSTPAISIKLNY